MLIFLFYSVYVAYICIELKFCKNVQFQEYNRTGIPEHYTLSFECMIHVPVNLLHHILCLKMKMSAIVRYDTFGWFEKRIRVCVTNSDCFLLDTHIYECVLNMNLNRRYENCRERFHERVIIRRHKCNLNIIKCKYWVTYLICSNLYNKPKITRVDKQLQ